MIITQALEELFLTEEYDSEDATPNGIDPRVIKPLSRLEFIEYVLIPETAILLIADDLQVDQEAAADIWEACCDYGQQKYSLTDEEIQNWAINKHKKKDLFKFGFIQLEVSEEPVEKSPQAESDIVIIE